MHAPHLPRFHLWCAVSSGGHFINGGDGDNKFYLEIEELDREPDGPNFDHQCWP